MMYSYTLQGEDVALSLQGSLQGEAVALKYTVRVCDLILYRGVCKLGYDKGV